MELITFNKTEYKRIERFRIATGAVAIFAAVLCGLGTLSTFRLVDLWGISSILISTIGGLFVIGAMILVAIFVFAYYGKKKTSLWGVSAFLMVASQAMMVLLSIKSVSGYSESIIPLFTVSSIITPLLSCIIFLLIAFAWFKQKKINVKVLSIILILLSLLTGVVPRIIIPISEGTFNVINLLGQLFASLYIVPYLLFLPFCSKSHKRVSEDSANSHIQEQEVLIGDLNFQLTSLKRDFENGKITKQEFEFRKRSLIDKL